MSSRLDNLLSIVRNAQADIRRKDLSGQSGLPSESQGVLPVSLFVGTRRKYLEQLVHQINGTFECGWFDACAVMVRRLLETLLIEVYEHKGIAHEIKATATGDYLMLDDIISRTLAQTAWSLGRDSKRALPRIKQLGDRSAHNRMFTAQFNDVEKIIPDIRVAVEELLHLSGLK